jgi:hypothetical protein
MSVKNEYAPVIEITVGETEHIPTEISFHSSKALDIKYFWEICSLLEENHYDSGKLTLTPDEIKSQALGHRENGRIIYDGEKNEVDYSLRYDGLDVKTKNKIEELLRSIPYVKIKI